MAQSWRWSALETGVMTVSSLVVGWLGNVYLVPLIFGIKVTHSQGAGMVAMFASMGFVQKFVIRRLFSRCE